VYSGLIASLALAALAAAPQAGKKASKMDADVAEVARRLTGRMDSSLQALVVPGYVHVRLTTCEVAWSGEASAVERLWKPGEAVLYQEQALASMLDKPYRQRLLVLRRGADGKQVESLVHKLEKPESLLGLCARPPEQRLVRPEEVNAPDCTVSLGKLGDLFVGSTPKGGCPNDFRGATTVTNETTLGKTWMRSWDRGFDTEGKQVWGATEGPYEFIHESAEGLTPADVHRVASWMSGRFDDRQQEKDPAMVTTASSCPVKLMDAVVPPELTGKRLLYYEENIPRFRHYIQRFWLIGLDAQGQQLELHTLHPPSGNEIRDLCSMPEEYRLVSSAQVGKKGCTLLIKRTAKGYEGATAPEGCPTNFRGAVKVAVSDVIREEGFDNFLQGLDASGKQVGGPSVPQQMRRVPDPDALELARRLDGKLDTSAQAARDPQFENVRYNNCFIRVKDNLFPGDQLFLFAEHTLDSPKLTFTRRRIIRIHRTDGGNTLVTDFRRVVNENAFANFCDRPEQDRAISISDVGATECGVYFQRVGDSFVGATRECTSRFRGASKLVINGRLDPDRNRIWERWFDDKGAQVAGSTKGPYEYLHTGTSASK
jgi:hypothetical protein